MQWQGRRPVPPKPVSALAAVRYIGRCGPEQISSSSACPPEFPTPNPGRTAGAVEPRPAAGVAAADEPPLAPPPRSAPPCLECYSSLSQTVPPSTRLLPDGSLAPVLSEELTCDVPWWRSSWAHLWPAG